MVICYVKTQIIPLCEKTSHRLVLGGWIGEPRRMDCPELHYWIGLL